MLLPTGLVTLLKLCCKVFDAQSFCGEQHDEVIEQIAAFIHQAFVAATHSFDDRFQSFFAHLLRHAIQSVAEKACGIRTFRHFLVSMLYEVLELGEEKQGIGFVLLAPAGFCARVANRAVGMSLHEERIAVAIGLDAYKVQKVAAGFTLAW